MSYVGSPTIGPTSSTNIDVANLIPEIQEQVIHYDNDGVPVQSFFSNPENAALIKTDQVLYQWQENQLDYPNATLITAIGVVAAGARQTVTVDMSDVVIGQVYSHPDTAQTFYVWNVTNVVPNMSCDITIELFPSTQVCVAVAVGELMRSMGIFIPEGGFYPAPRGTKPARLSNIVALRSCSYGITRTQIGSPTYFGDPLQYNQIKQLRQGKNDSERMYIFGRRIEELGVTQSNPNGNGTQTGALRVSLGLYHRIVSNISLYSGRLTEDTFDSYMNTSVWGNRNHGSNYKIGLHGPDLINDINRFAKDKYRVMSPNNSRAEYGMDIQVIIFNGGKRLLLMEEREFYEGNLRHALVTIDPNHMKIRHKRDSYIEVYPDTQQNNQDQIQTSLVWEDGLQVEVEQFHSRLGWS